MATRARNNPKKVTAFEKLLAHILFDILRFFSCFSPFSIFLVSVSNFGLVKINILDWIFVIVVSEVLRLSSSKNVCTVEY